jgi:uncharacterized protein YjbI with pentapeptide repeats
VSERTVNGYTIRPFANLRWINLQEADLRKAGLRKAGLRGEDLDREIVHGKPRLLCDRCLAAWERACEDKLGRAREDPTDD